MDFTPVEFRKWKAQVSTFFEASNLQHASMKEQHGYLHMCLDAKLTNHLNVNSTAANPVMAYLDLDLSVFSALLNALINAQSRKGTRDAGQLICLNSPALARGWESRSECSGVAGYHWSVLTG